MFDDESLRKIQAAVMNLCGFYGLALVASRPRKDSVTPSCSRPLCIWHYYRDKGMRRS